MQAETLTTPAGSRFARSHSSPSIPDLVKREERSALPRSASFTFIPSLEGGRPEKAAKETIVSSPDGRYGGEGMNTQGSSAKLSKDERPKLEIVGRRKSLVSRPKSWIQRVKGSPERQNSLDLNPSSANDAPPVTANSKANRDKSSKVSESFVSFARKSWITSSRPPSPVRISAKDSEYGKQRGREGHTTLGNTMPKKLVAQNVERPATARASDSPQKLDKRNSTIRKMKARPQNVLMNFTNSASANSSSSSLPRSSLDKSTPGTSIDKVPPIPKAFSTEKLQSLGKDGLRRKDELWSAFRSLDSDYTKFQAKSWSLKTNVVRSALLPFLKSHASHPSNRNLRPEDLDRRITILNKWWSGLLEVLDGRQNQTVSGVDRPILLEACYSIMIRPEWRLHPSHFAPLSDRSASRSPERLSNRKSSGSLNSSASQFLTESVYHNTRNLFIRNLLAQVSFVVDKMSMRHAPASLVTFCGKAIAYAFFFVPSIADVLVRVWKLQPDTLRRVSDELGLPRRASRSDTDDVCAAFPSHLKALGWTSTKAMASTLRESPSLSIMVSKINWYGHWATRWCGRDSDLFFIFAKHYHILAEEFMPVELPLHMKARVPSFVLVHAQLLTALDATTHRQAPSDPLPITFDDVLSGADASAAALPLPSTNSSRPMAENRLIMLLRDFLSERSSEYEDARSTFASAFAKMMQASAKKTSLFDHNASFVLCDFMEEALTIYVRFHDTQKGEEDHIDWWFWLNVCKKVLESSNSMSEIRLFAFIYGAWTIISKNETRKEVMCLDWLLSEDMFWKFFYHWCPMVRAYYMRLLCWRLCRDDGEASDLDFKIFSAVSTRLKTAWSHYLFLQQFSETAKILPPSTAPCNPAPGRRFLIIRNDYQAPSANIFLGFDGITTSTSNDNLSTSPSKKTSLAALTKLDGGADVIASKPTEEDGSLIPKKRWTLMGVGVGMGMSMGRMMPGLDALAPNGNMETAKEKKARRRSSTTSKSHSVEKVRKETALARSRPLPARPSSTSLTHVSNEVGVNTNQGTNTKALQTHRAYCFKFSLEWEQHFEKPAHLLGQNVENGASMRDRNGAQRQGPNERKLIPPRLPSPAQLTLGSRIPGLSNEIFPSDPCEPSSSSLSKNERLAAAKYAGRALAEWGLIVMECNNFVERRRQEGVPNLKLVEIPTLGVEGFRRFGG